MSNNYKIVADQSCPKCHHRLRLAAALGGDGGAPNEGDPTICWYCGEYMIFDANLVAQTMTTDQWNALSQGIKLELTCAKHRIKRDV